LVVIVGLLASCATSIRSVGGESAEATAEAFAKSRNTKGIVLLDVNWGRRWSCGGFENAELRGLAFDRAPVAKSSNDTPADLILVQPPNLASRQVFDSYALLVEPGQYALASFSIKVARSVSDIAYWVAERSDLLKNGEALGGTFKVAAGETVYIGNFFLDCFQRPQLWRYYTEGVENFTAHLAQYKQKYPFLDVDHVTYRLFETTSLGHPYELK
jgi:hypothetical protein